MQNTEDDKIIAEFMGLKQYPKTILWDTDGYSGYQEEEEKDMWVLNPTPVFDEHLRIYRDYYEDIGIERPFDDYFFTLKYHTSWDWIMPVVEKIRSLGYRVYMHALPDCSTVLSGCDIACMQMDDITHPSFNCTAETIQGAVCKTVIEFIKYYNNQKNGNSKK